MSLVVSWGSDPDEQASSVQPDDLAPLLRELSRTVEAPILVDVVNESGDSLTIGVGLPVSVLNLVASSGEPPYYTSSATADSVSTSVWFDYFGSESEFLPEQVVPFDDALATVVAWGRSGDMSRVKWVEV